MSIVSCWAFHWQTQYLIDTKMVLFINVTNACKENDK